VALPDILVTMSGTLEEISPSDEIWQCGVHLSAIPAPTGTVDLQTYVDTIATALGTWYSASGSAMCSTSHLTQLKAAYKDATGHYAFAPGVHTYGTPPAGNTATQGGPSFTSIAYSWTTGITTGKRGRFGRIYPPNYTYPPFGAAITGANAALAATAAKALLNILVNAGGSGVLHNMTPVVYSGVAGAAYPITGVRVGNVYDVQRRRKDAVPETYATVAFP
jgi:hypothetical protein